MREYGTQSSRYLKGQQTGATASHKAPCRMGAFLSVEQGGVLGSGVSTIRVQASPLGPPLSGVGKPTLKPREV